MKNYRELDELKVCWTCVWIQFEVGCYCNHPEAVEEKDFVSPIGMCDNYENF